jgi:1D-myo-inositol 3-kinase
LLIDQEPADGGMRVGIFFLAFETLTEQACYKNVDLMHIPQFLAIGHVTQDLVGNGLTPGGPALYSTCAARNLGLQTGMVTSYHEPFLQPTLLKGIDIHCQSARHTTTFTNLYDEHGKRRQMITGVAERILPAQIPTTWRQAAIVNLCPVADEYPAEIAQCFPQALIGVCPQGWMRQWDAAGQVMRKPWATFAEVLPHADVVFYSEDDVDAPEALAQTYLVYTDLVVITRGKRGASVYCPQQVEHVPAFLAAEVDPTGAGDVFATAFLIEYAATRDPRAAARFANCVASFVVEKEGVYGIPTLAEVQHRLATCQQ